MRYVRICLLIAQAALLAGCFPTIYSREQLGEIQALNADQWNGAWSEPALISGRRIVRIRVVDAGRAVIGVWKLCPENPAYVEYLQVRSLPVSEEPPGFQWLVLVPQRLASSGDFVPYTKDPPFDYMKFSVPPHNDVWIWYFVADDRVAALIEQGVLPGQVEGGRAILGHLESNHYNVLASVDHPVVHWELPMVHFRMPPEYDPCPKQEPAK